MSKQGCLFSYKNTIYWPIRTSFQPNMEFITSHLINYLPCGFNQCFYDQQARSDHVQDTLKTHSKYRSHWRAIGSDDRKH